MGETLSESSRIREPLVAVIGMGHPEALVLFVEKLLTFIRGGMADSRALVALQESSHCYIVNIVESRPLSRACSSSGLIKKNCDSVPERLKGTWTIVDSRWLCQKPSAPVQVQCRSVAAGTKHVRVGVNVTPK
jgi:hypothetical protein